MLLNSGGEVNRSDSLGRTPLMYACMNGQSAALGKHNRHNRFLFGLSLDHLQYKHDSKVEKLFGLKYGSFAKCCGTKFTWSLVHSEGRVKQIWSRAVLLSLQNC